MKIKWHIEARELSTLKKWGENPRIMTEKGMKDLKKSLDRFGLAEPLVIQPDGLIIGGHARYDALIAAGETSADCYVPENPLTEKQVRELNVRLNRNQAGEFDFGKLAEWDTAELVEWGFEEGELKINLAEGETDPDDVPEMLIDDSKCKFGDLWILGDHRLLCGDSSDGGNISLVLDGKKASCIFTDPPYGVSIGKKNVFLNSFQPSGRNLSDIEDDDLSPADLKEKLLPVFNNIRKLAMDDDCTLFVTAPQGGELGMMMMMMMQEARLPPRHVLIWKKNSPTFSMGRLDYDYAHEPILLTWGKKHKRPMAGMHKTSVWEIDKPRANKEHPTMKPVELYVNAYLNNSDTGDIVFDPYAGSGTGIISAEQTNRKCCAIEYEPKYCDVILNRWSKFTGKIPVHENGTPWDITTPS